MTQASNPLAALTPSAWVVRHAALIAPGARVLDLAAGHGRQSVFLAARGARVVAVDKDAAALATFAATPGVTTRVADLEGADWPLEGERFDAIVCVHYLHRPRLGDLLAMLVDDGVLIYETFATGNEVFGRPSNPAYLLRDGELLVLVRERMSVVAFEQGVTVQYGTNAVIQRIAAIGRRVWPPPLAM
ncbi:MAG TPA: class I SAM-dependent methyltransferase [Casimicrobiaceae bacterium]|jgi:SAM-dependent methyltransferase